MISKGEMIMKTFTIKITGLIFTAALLLGASGCKSSNDSLNLNGGAVPTVNPNQATTNEGGISAGGGGTLPAHPIYPFRVTQILAESQRQLRLYFNFIRKYNREYKTDLDQKFFFGDLNLATQLEKTSIEILEDKPCLDRNGHEVDASIVATRPNTICFSAYRVAPKLVEEIANKEIVALLVHELSHFLGSTEDEAVQLQQLAAIFLAKVSLTEQDKLASFIPFIDASDRLSQGAKFQENALQKIKNGQIQEARAEIDEAYNKLTSYNKYFENLPFAFLDYKLENYKTVLQGHLRLVSIFLDGLDSTNPLSSESKARYEKCFGDKTEVSAEQIKANCDLIWDKIFDQGYVFKKATTGAEAIGDLRLVKLFMHELSTQVRWIGFNEPLVHFTMPDSLNEPHPWQQFSGKYLATVITCETTDPKGYNSFQNLKSVELAGGIVQYPVDNLPVVNVTEKYGSMSATTSFYNNAGNGVMLVTGDSDTATMTEEKGTRWYDRQDHGASKITKSIVRSDVGLIFNMKSEWFSNSYRGFQTGQQNCQYRLTATN